MNMPAAAFSDKLAAVDALDAAGRHSDAINLLAQATGRGDMAAMAVLGHRLLIGDRAPLLPADAVRFLVDAAKRGVPGALERVAALTAGGVHLRQSWPEALKLLGQAAKAGSASAAAQLRILAGSQDAGSDWARVAQSVNLARWVAATAGTALGGIAQIRSYPDFMPKDFCDWLIDAARPRLEPARVYDQVTGRNTVAETRSNSSSTFKLTDVGVLHFVLQAKMSAACGQPLPHMEAPAVLHYAIGEQITDHYDFVDPQSPNYREHLRQQGQRMATFLLYLNDEYEGGETDFPTLGVRQKGEVGMGLCFLNALPDGEPDLRMLHAGRPPLRGEKWIVSQFIRSRPLRG